MFSRVENLIFRFEISSDGSTVACSLKDEHIILSSYSVGCYFLEFLTFSFISKFKGGSFYKISCLLVFFT